MPLEPLPTPPRGEFSPPAEILVRAAFLLTLAAFTGGVVLVLAGIAAQQLRLLAGGAAALGLAALVRHWLQRKGRLEAASAALDSIAARADDDHATRLLELLEQWEELEGRRGTAAFDPWALQAVRNDIRAAVDRDPALAELFQELRRAA